ncbi:MAG: prolyl oligopeptidase family serine peptidase [Pirellulaceae bacterium]
MKLLLKLASPIALVCLFLQSAAAEIAPIERRLPPEGIEIPADVRQRLEERLATTKQRLEELDGEDLKPDVEIFTKAVEYALLHREFYSPKDFEKADWALDQASERLSFLAKDELAKDGSPWASATGLAVRGYRSSIDGSAQPYGLVIPEGHDLSKPSPLYVWLHGRGDKSTDLHFLRERATKTGQIAPAGAIVLHPFGRQCVGWKHAGEIDVLEAIASVQERCAIDRRRIVLIGFSMGGAGAWHIGAHYTDRFIAVSPGAGFAETARYQRLTSDRYPPAYEQTLWGAYDVPGYVRNLFNTRVIAYSGELDKQIQAARVMEEAYADEGRKLEHLIGPGVEHKYEPQTLKELMHRLETVVALTDVKDIALPREVHLQTRTLRYPVQKWLRAEGLEEHWKEARIDAALDPKKGIELTTRNVTRLRLDEPYYQLAVKVDGQEVGAGSGVLLKEAGKWRWATEEDISSSALRKKPGLQGPIDDAFLRKFVVVEPSGKSRNPAFQAWCDFELQHFKDRWRALMRGELPVVRDVDFKATEGNVILWGDPDSNSVLRASIEQLPVAFQDGNWTFGGKVYPGDRFVPALIYPRANQKGYFVLNSGLTFREAHDRTNSLQNPKLPDWALIDLTQPPDALLPGRIHDAGFFDEAWQFKAPPKEAAP